MPEDRDHTRPRRIDPVVRKQAHGNDFAGKFRLALEALNWSRARCANELGVDKSVISRWASGGAAPTEHNLTRFTALLRQMHPRFQLSAWRLDPAAFAVLFEAGVADAADVTAHHPTSLSDQPSIAVLPFTNMSGEADQDYFVDGMVDEIITALSRIRWLFVMARNSSFTYKGQSVDVKQVGEELGVRYVLEGAVRKAGDRVRISARLIDARTRAHLWADRFDGLLEDVFDLQDKVAARVGGVIEPALQAAETIRSAERPTADLTAYDLYLRAYAMVWSSATKIPEALRLMEQAITLDPTYGPALAWAAACCQRLIYDDRSENPAVDRQKGAAFARRALAVAGDDPGVLTNAAVALAGFGEDIDAMMGLVDRALALNPNYARGWHISGVLREWAGQPDVAIAHAEAALRLSPRARIGTSLLIIGCAHFFMRQFEEAEAKLRLAIQEDPSFPQPYRFLAAAYAHMNRLGEARDVVERLRTVTRQLVPDASVLRDAGHRELFLSGLRRAATNFWPRPANDLERSSG